MDNVHEGRCVDITHHCGAVGYIRTPVSYADGRHVLCSLLHQGPIARRLAVQDSMTQRLQSSSTPAQGYSSPTPYLLDCCFHVVFLWCPAPQCVNREGAPRDGEHRGTTKEICKLAGIQSCTGDNQLEVSTHCHHLHRAVHAATTSLVECFKSTALMPPTLQRQPVSDAHPWGCRKQQQRNQTSSQQHGSHQNA